MDIRYDFSFFLMAVKYVFLPVFVVVVIAAIFVYMYSNSIKKKDLEKYEYIVELWTNLLAIIIIGGLFAVTLGFSMSLTKSIRQFNLEKQHQIIYYLVIATPSIPFCFFVYYVYQIAAVILNNPKRKKKSVKKENKNFNNTFDNSSLDDFQTNLVDKNKNDSDEVFDKVANSVFNLDDYNEIIDDTKYEVNDSNSDDSASEEMLDDYSINSENNNDSDDEIEVL